MLHARQHPAQGRRIPLGRIGRDPCGHTPGFGHRPLKESVCSISSASFRAGGLNDFPVLIDRSVDGGPAPSGTTIRFVNAPFRADGSSVRPRRHREQWEKVLDPALDRAALHHEAALGEPLHDIGLPQAIAHIPAHGERDQIIGKRVARERTRRTGRKVATAGGAPPALPA